MNTDINLHFSPAALKKALTKFLHRFHVILFVIIVVGGSAIVIFMLNNVIIRSGENDGYTSDTNNATFDQSTMKRIEELKTRDQNNTMTLPGGRTNPFVE